MRVLALESSGPLGGVALLEDGRVLGEILFEKGMVHGRDIAPAADRLLKAAGKRPADLDLVAVDIGPGSYTGVRVGLAAAKGFALALGRPVVGVVSLDALAHDFVKAAPRFGAVLDAKWDQVYGALYEVRDGRAVRTAGPFAEAPAEFARRCAGLPVVGDGPERHAAAFPGITALAGSKVPRPAAIGELGWRDYREGVRHDAATIVPMYLRKTEAEEKFGKK